MTAAEGLDHVFFIIWNSTLKTNISGAVRRYLRPTNSNNEDVTINVLNPIDFEQLQEGIFNVNVFVPNPEYSATVDGKAVRLRDLPNQQRISVLSAFCNVVLKFNYDKTKHVLLELQTQNILPENEQTIINNRVKLTIKNL
ncbi:hypothetical protein [Sphingobacterium bovisgrunnientis]|uniref:hypothetical protein n=1 Tax=Sphingobacterium bovisgrunnientis TaxID=1874697 RepID=UPI00135AD41E|nr:hypothetical protein [Sphingobacterium bovisgrunnientis]